MRVDRLLLLGAELVILTVLILATRCANYQDVFIGRDVYFTDADCYARMTRVRLCASHPGLIVRHHHFENFPQGTTPHTTAPLDYLILGLSLLVRPFAPNAVDLAGALISPLLAVGCGWFLWWWSRGMRFRWAILILYITSPILVHGTELGRPDHQSLLMALLTVAICTEWRLLGEPSRSWSATSGVAWSLAIWVSAYEPALLLLVVVGILAVQDRQLLVRADRRLGWAIFAAIIVLALLIERRVPSLSILRSDPILNNWKRTIGELRGVSPLNAIWFRWTGYVLVIAPILIWIDRGKKSWRLFAAALLVTTYCLTIWQARWAYFFVSIFVISLPVLVGWMKSSVAVWAALGLSMLPILRDWDEKIWPNETELARRFEQRRENVELRDLARRLVSVQVQPFLAPWWLSPSIAYWSGQPGVAGSSHESLDGITEASRFFLADDPDLARAILLKHGVASVFAYDSERTVSNAAAILAVAPSVHAMGRVLDRTPAQAPGFLTLEAENGTAKLFRARLSSD